MAGGIVLVLLSSGAGLALPALAGNVVGASTSTEALSSLVLLLVGLLLAQIFLNASGRYLLAHGGETTVFRLRQKLLHRALFVQIQAAHEVRVGDFISRVSADTTLLRDALSRGFVEMFISVPFIIGASILMARLDASLFLIVGATIAATMAAATVFVGKVRGASIVAQSEMGNLSADVERALSATRTIKIAQAEAAEQDRLSRSARNAWRAGIRTARVISAASPMVQLAGSGALFAGLIIGAAKVGQGSLELSALISFMLYTLYLLTPLNSILEGVSSIRQAEGALQRVNETLDIPVENVSRNGKDSPKLYPDVDAPALVLDSVSFSYPDRPAVLNGVDLILERGGRAAIVGPSGVGKSTLLALICNFYQPSRGRVLVGGHDVSDVQQDVRQLIGLVEQESAMLAGTVRENLLMTRPDADTADLFEVLRIVGMADAVSRLPQGVDSDIGEHGQLLSGGQRQRLAIARALLGKPSLLLLDEPTSNLDEYNEKTVLDAIDSLPDDQTVLLISHRESTLRVARQVVLIDEAGVSEEGRTK